MSADYEGKESKSFPIVEAGGPGGAHTSPGDRSVGCVGQLKRWATHGS